MSKSKMSGRIVGKATFDEGYSFCLPGTLLINNVEYLVNLKGDMSSESRFEGELTITHGEYEDRLIKVEIKDEATEGSEKEPQYYEKYVQIEPNDRLKAQFMGQMVGAGRALAIYTTIDSAGLFEGITNGGLSIGLGTNFAEGLEFEIVFE